MTDLLWHPSSQNSKERLPEGQEGPRDGGAVGSTWQDLLKRKMDAAGIDYFSAGRWEAGHGRGEAGCGGRLQGDLSVG